jgi:cysteine desulfuration protein SufE
MVSGVRERFGCMHIYTSPQGATSRKAGPAGRRGAGGGGGGAPAGPAVAAPLPRCPAASYLSTMPPIDSIIPRFKAADRTTRLETLLDYSRKLPPLPERLEAEKARGENRVHECQTPVFLWVEVENGQVHIHADVPRESPTVRGFVSLLARSLDGASPEAVAQVPDDLLDQLGLSETLGMTRTQGLTAILHRIKRSVATG